MYFSKKRSSQLGDIPAAARRNVSYQAPPDFQIAELPPGREGAIATLKQMRSFVDDSQRDPAQLVRNQALSLVESLPARKWFAEIDALHQFVKNQVRYVRDPEDYELVQTPQKTLEIRQGDCDDKSTLLAALLKSIGHPARFVAVGFSGDDLSHVLVQTKVNNTGDDNKDWMSLETIIDKPAGWFPSGVTSRYVLKV